MFGRGISGQPGDSIGSIYDLWSLQFFNASPIATYTNTLIGYPAGVIVHGTASISAILIQFPALILSEFFSEIIAYNIMAFLGFILPPLLMYVLLRGRNFNIGISYYGAFGFLFFPFHMYSFMAWPSLAQTAWLPLCQIYIDRISGGQKRFRWVIPILISALACLSNGYIGLMTLVLLFVGYGNLLIQEKNLKRAIRNLLGRKMFVVVTLILLATCLVVVMLLVAAIKKDVVRNNFDLYVYGLRLGDLFLPPSNSIFRTPLSGLSSSRSLHGSNEIETAQFLGYGTVSLAVLWIVISIRKRKIGMILPDISLALVAIWFGMSQGISLFGVGLPSPAQMLTNAAPFWRAYSRFGILIMLAMLLLACRSLEFLQNRIKGPARCFLVGIATIILIVELPVRLPQQTLEFKTPDYVAYLSHVDGIIVNYPLAMSNDGLVYQRRFWQRKHQLPMINGYIDTDRSLIDNSLEDVRKPGISGKLFALGVKWVIIDWSLYPETDGNRKIADPDLQRKISFGDVEIYENISNNAEPIANIKDGIFPREMNIGNEPFNWMSDHAAIEVIGGLNQCVSLELFVSPFSGMKNLVFLNSSKQVASVLAGMVKIDLKLHKGYQIVKLESDVKPIQIPGPDPRAVTFQLSQLRVSPTSRC